MLDSENTVEGRQSILPFFIDLLSTLFSYMYLNNKDKITKWAIFLHG